MLCDAGRYRRAHAHCYGLRAWLNRMISQDFEAEMKKAASSSECERSYEMPDGQVQRSSECTEECWLRGHL